MLSDWVWINIDAMTDTNSNNPEPKTAEGPLSLSSITHLGQYTAAALAVTYVCGFIVVTAYMGILGIRDYESFRVEYIIAGVMFLLLAGMYHILVGRRILLLDEYSKEFLESLDKGWSHQGFWHAYTFAFPLLEASFGLAMATCAMYGFIFEMKLSLAPLFSTIVFAASVPFFLIPTRKKLMSSKLRFLLTGALYVVTFVVFNVFTDGLLKSLYDTLYFATVMMAIIFILRHDMPNSRGRLTVYFLVLMLVTFSGLFGHKFYGHVRPSIGGGQPEHVQIVINDRNTPTSIKNKLHVVDSLSSDVDLIARTDSELYLGLPPRTEEANDQQYATLITLDRKLIKAIIRTKPMD